MDIGLLGALDVRENGVSVTPSAPKPRQVLALLALHVDQVVPLSVLVEELWGDAPPRSARTTLQTYVLQLRELIAAALCRESAGEGGAEGAGDVGVPAPADAGGGAGVGRVRGAKDVLVTSPGGYLLVGGG
ncbi:winged helix-turn-helix domain-containing protein, partial [Streptomyces sp. NPDC005485]|uniref:AfsR/SARP family transcriptional regulator n=1 Tax=Streptomyces sp. NPDC005485 TaxID=3155591 RepID=UPI0033B4BB88